MNRRLAFAGVLTAVAYVASLGVLHAGGGVRVRPLYDGFAPPPPYRWVNPPADLASTNIAPQPGSATEPVSSDKAASLAFETGDTQASLTIDLSAIGLAAGDTAVRGTLTPSDPAAYAPLPDGQRASGNVYRVEVVAQPLGRAVTAFAKPGSLSLSIANSAGTTLYGSDDGRTWRKVVSAKAEPYVIANIDRTGYYVLAGPAGLLPSIAPRATPASRGGGGDLVAVVVSAVIALGAVAGVALLLRRRSP